MNRVALITGGSRGLGLAIARELQDRGFDLLLAANSAAALDAAKSSLRQDMHIEYVAGDLTLSQTTSEIAEVCAQRFNRLDLLVNNAGVFIGGTIEDFSEESWDRTIDVNLKASFLMTKSVAPLLRKSQGLIVFINSVGGKVGLAGLSAYSASKFGLRGLADSLRLELKPQGIRVTSIYPHAINSAEVEIPPDSPERMAKIETSDIARMVGEVADAPPHLQVPEIVLYPRSTEIGKQERSP